MPRSLTIKALGDELDLNPSTIRRYVAEGMPATRAARGKLLFDGNECAAWMKAKGKSGQIGRTPAEVSEKTKAAQLRKIEAMAGLHELRLEREREQVLDRAAVESANVAKFQAIRTKLLTLPASLAPVLVGQDVADVQQIIEQNIREALAELAAA